MKTLMYFDKTTRELVVNYPEELVQLKEIY